MLKTIFLSIFLCCFILHPCQSEPFEVTVKSGKTNIKYLMMRSDSDVNQWYCAKLSPTLYEYKSDNEALTEPALTFIRFQKIDPAKPDKLIEGAILECEFDIGVDKSTLNILKNKLPLSDRSLARVNLLPINGLEMVLIRPSDSSELKIKAKEFRTKTDKSGSTTAVFYGVLSSSDAVLLNALLSHTGGVRYRIDYKYNSVSEPEKIVAKIDYGKSKSIYGIKGEQNEDAALLSHLASKSKNPRLLQKIKEKSKSSVREETSSSPDNDDKQETFDIRNIGHKKINTGTGSAKSSISELIDTVELVYKTRKEKFIAADGLITLANYSDEIRNKKMFTDVSYDDWKFAYLMAPAISAGADLQIENITLNIHLCDNNHVYEKRKIYWKGDSGWQDETGNPSSIAKFSLEDILSRPGKSPLDKAFFKISSVIKFKKDSDMVSESEIPVLSGGIPITTPLVMADVIEFDFINLFWDALKTDTKRLKKIDLTVKDGSRTIKRVIEPKLANDKHIEYPQILCLAVTRGNFEKGKIKANLYFHTADRKRVAWDFNGLKLSEYFDIPYFMFFDEDWQKTND
ncbi:MAG: hypothetical protein ACOX2I_10155 [Candidatus Ozemobacteraceae bacterium]